MEWTSPFVIFRVGPEGKLSEVYHATDIKKAKYWLTYIAQPGDVLCKTPAHPRHSKSGKAPEYWSHKAASGQPLSEEKHWRAMVKDFKIIFPEEQTGVPGEKTPDGQSN